MDPKTLSKSGFHIHSFGIVVEDKTNDDDYIKVYPVETLPLAKGKISEITYDYNVSGTDHKGVAVNSNVQGIAFVVAQYVAIGDGNRQTAPNVYESETVLIWRYANDDKYYWTDLMREPTLRRLENVIWAVSNLQDKGAKFDEDSSHWIQFSSRDQVVKLHTSKNRDEPAGFDVTFDLANGTLTIEDTEGNNLFWDAVNGDLKWNMNNSFELNTKMIRFNGTQYMHSVSPEITEDGQTNKRTASESITDVSQGTVDSEATGSHTIKGATVLSQASGLNTVQGGNVVITGGTVAID